ncbi:MAG TPA: class I SAM-dependent methyltransferase [Lysobacter sp.]
MRQLKRIVRRIYPFDRLLQQRDEALARAAALERERDVALSRLADVSEDCLDPSGPDAEALKHRLLRFDTASLASSTSFSTTPLELTDHFRSYFRDVLLSTFYRDLPTDLLTNPAVETGIAEHLDGRYLVFAQHMIPWILQARGDLSDCVALEIGSGTGASTLAFAPHVREAICFEIDEVATEAARQRLAYFGLRNVTHCGELFGPDCDFVASGRKADLIVLCAVLEHMSYEELITALRTAWNTLAPGGLLVVADTPNRFAIVDHHTSLLPYYSALPYEIMVDYARRFSPRAEFAAALESDSPDGPRHTVVRWGRGISYHEFELAIGPEVHDRVILDGYEPLICAATPPTLGDALLRLAFHYHGIAAHRAFTRSNLYFVLQK